MQADRALMHDAVFAFFHDIVPPNPNPNPGPSPPGPKPPHPSKECQSIGGIISKDGIACCPAKCGRCGGQGCPQLPGGKEDCCGQEVEKNAPSCKTSGPPCVVH